MAICMFLNRSPIPPVVATFPPASSINALTVNGFTPIDVFTNTDFVTVPRLPRVSITTENSPPSPGGIDQGRFGTFAMVQPHEVLTEASTTVPGALFVKENV